MKVKIINAMLAFVATPEGKNAFNTIYGVTDLKKSTDTDYDSVRDMFKILGKDPSEFLKK